jgi:hypothetical protein
MLVPTGSDGSGGSGESTGAGATGGSGYVPPPPLAYPWTGVTLYIGSVPATVDGSLFVFVTDRASPPALDATLQFGRTMRWDPTSGAAVTGQESCDSFLSSAQLVSCGGQSHLDREATARGCLAAVFTPEGTTGNFIDPSGARCDIVSSTGSIAFPWDWLLSLDGSWPHGNLNGDVTFDCEGSDGTNLQLEAKFTLPFSIWTQPC